MKARRPPNLALIGFMGSGKSTVGRACARELGLPFRDSDTLVEQRAGMSIPEIFARDGEAAFRKLEAEAIRALASNPPIVLSTGGGAPMHQESVDRLRRTGIVVLLWADPDCLLARVGQTASRPLLATSEDPGERIRTLLAQREPYYRAAAHVVVDTTNLSRDEAVQRVLDAYRNRASAAYSHTLPSPSSRGKGGVAP